MATQVSILLNPRLKAMVIPREHGAWGMMLVPLATGAIVAAQSSSDFAALSLLVLAALALFWMRTPAEAWLGTTAIKAHSLQERSTVLRVSVCLTLVAVAAILSLFFMGLWRGLVLVGAISALAFGLQAMIKRFGRSGRMPAQMIGAVGLTSTAAGAYYVSTGRLDRTAFALWLANWLFAGDQVHFVQVRIHGCRLSGVAAKLPQAAGFFAGQLVLLTGILVLIRLGFFPRLTLVAFVPALARGFLWFLRGAETLDVRKLGFSELAQALVFGAMLCIAFLI